MDLSHLKSDFPILRTEMNGRPLVYLDSASTSQKPSQVIRAVDEYYSTKNANVHRATYDLASAATNAYEEARGKVARFINASDVREIVFTRGTTSAINLIAWGWGMYNLSAGDKVVLTRMEHHANIVPWQLVKRFTNCELIYLDLTEDYDLDIEQLERLVDDRVKIIGVSGMSNVLGTTTPLQEISRVARRVGAKVAVDAAQLVPHHPVDVQALGVDFLAFSSHKMLGPTGIGAMWSRLDELERMEPLEGGGEMIMKVGPDESTWADVPHKFEAGTPPIAQAVGMGAAIDYLEAIGMDRIREHEVDLTAYALQRLAAFPELKVFGSSELAKRGGVISFNLGDIHAHDVQTILSEEGIAVRAGHHCCQPLMRALEVPATVRASLHVYNTPEDVDRLAEGLERALKIFGR